MEQAYYRILFGQIFLILCCIFYLVWWAVSYRPGESVDRVAGFRVLLLLLTAGSGITGVILCILGIRDISQTQSRGSGLIICLLGLIAYVILLLITRFGFQRPVTTELFLITGWGVLEYSVLSSAANGSLLTGGSFTLMLLVTAASLAVSLILYVLYYRMESWRAYYTAMVPLLTEAVSMGLLSALLITGSAA